MTKEEKLKKVNDQIEFSENRLKLARESGMKYIIKNAALILQQLRDKKKEINKSKKNKPSK